MTGRAIIIAVIYVALLIGGAYVGSLLTLFFDADIRTIHNPEMQPMIVATTVIFAIASAVPFVAGAEIGLGMILVLGGQIAPLVYGAMLFALTLSFVVGRIVPMQVTARMFGAVGLEKARDLVLRLEPLHPKERLEMLFENAPTRFIPFLLRNRYLALMIVINVPGNTLIGGGGGIAFAAGLSGLFTFPKYVLAISIAILPIPAIYYVMS